MLCPYAQIRQWLASYMVQWNIQLWRPRRRKGTQNVMVNFLAAAAHYYRQSRIHFDKSFNYILHHSTISAVCAMMCSIIFLNNFLNLVREMCFFSFWSPHGNIEIDKANENEKSICFGSHDVDPSGPMQHSLCIWRLKRHNTFESMPHH